jgi:hypothetical protein
MFFPFTITGVSWTAAIGHLRSFMSEFFFSHPSFPFCLFFPFLYAIIHGGRVTHCLILRSWVTSNCLEKCSYIKGVIEDVLGKSHRRAVRHAQCRHRLLLVCLVSLDLICMIKVITFPYKRLINVNVNVNVKKNSLFLVLWLKFVFIIGVKYCYIVIWCLFYKYIFSIFVMNSEAWQWSLNESNSTFS